MTYRSTRCQHGVNESYKVHTTYTQPTHNLHTTYTQPTHNLHTTYTQPTHNLHIRPAIAVAGECASQRTLDSSRVIQNEVRWSLHPDCGLHALETQPFWVTHRSRGDLGYSVAIDGMEGDDCEYHG